MKSAGMIACILLRSNSLQMGRQKFLRLGGIHQLAFEFPGYGVGHAYLVNAKLPGFQERHPYGFIDHGLFFP